MTHHCPGGPAIRDPRRRQTSELSPRRTGIPYPEDALSDWQNFVALCEEGYDDNEFEYAFDLDARGLLEEALNDPELNRLPGIEWLRREVAEIDERFRRILHEQPVDDPEHHPWWRAYVPYYGGREFAEDIQELYGVTLHVVD
ncbi:hypothetical protein [Actinopolyspora mortivallis]|uniref:hypothetical protein n=1 Tax=Actinopolyspora mortivallis TaxID=33906 RepID=UPI0015E62683|nr:hypothetical protein [Actinopolyspora mortivallis]